MDDADAPEEFASVSEEFEAIRCYYRRRERSRPIQLPGAESDSATRNEQRSPKLVQGGQLYPLTSHDYGS